MAIGERVDAPLQFIDSLDENRVKTRAEVTLPPNTVVQRLRATPPSSRPYFPRWVAPSAHGARLATVIRSN